MTMPWPTLALEELASVQRGKFSARPRNDPKYYGGGIPFIQTGDVANGAGRVRTYSQTLNDAGLSVSKLFPKGSLVVTIAANIGDVARVEFDFSCPDSLVVVQAKEGVNSDWLQYSLESKKELLDSLAPQNAQKNINLEVLRPLALDVPPFREQQRIAGALGSWDTAIQKTEQLIAAKERSSKALMQKIFRTDSFPRRRLSELTSRVTRKNAEGDGHPLTISGAEGLISQSRYFGKRIAAEKTEHYTLLKRGEYAYNRSYSAGYPLGAVKRLDVLDEGIVSTLYLCFALNECNAPMSDYFAHFCEAGGFNHQIYKIAQEGARNHGLLNVTADDFFSMTMPIPPLEVQQHVVKALGAVMQELYLLRNQLAALRIQKRGLMQKLLTGQWRLTLNPDGEST